MFNPTWLYTGAVYAGAVWLARRGGIDLPRRVAVFFYALVFVFFYPVLTQDAVNTSVDFLGTLPPWQYTVPDGFRAGDRQLNDLALQIVPWAHQVREGWRSLTPPLWNNFSGGGYPLLASPQSSALSPLRILGLPLSLAHSLSFEAAMKVLIALTFTFLWCRRRGYSELASSAGAVAFGFSTFVIAWLHFPLITTACLVPAVFYVLDLLAERVTYARFVALSLIGAAMLFGGHPETVAHTALLAALYVLWLVLVERGSPRVLLAIAGASVVTLLLAAPFLAPFAEAVTKSKRYQIGGVNGILGIAAWLAVAVLTAWAMNLITRDRGEERAAARPISLLLLVAIISGLWIASRDRNPVVSSEWMYPKTPMLRALDDLAKDVPPSAPFRIAGNAATFFPNVSAVYGYEDVRAHDPMANGRYIGLLSHVVNYDPTESLAPWPDWEHPLLDYLNVRYVLTTPGGQPPPRFHLRYDGKDGRIFENADVSPRFFAVPNVVIDYNDASYAMRLKNHRDWSQTALLETLDLESEQQREDFFRPRPPGAPIATTKILQAMPTDYRLHVRAPRWSLIVSSVPWWPGWKVERNGARVEPIRVNGAFLGFAVPPGELDVRVWYDPWTFRFGTIVAAATLIALAAYGVRRRS